MEYPGTYLYKRIVQAKLFIDEQFHLPIGLDNIAGEACFSKFHFIRLFKNSYGKTPHQYLSFVRIEKAKHFLQQGMSVTDACFSAGFNSITSFTALFKRHTDMRPSGYRQMFLARRQQVNTVPLQFIPGCFARQYGITDK